MLIRLRLRPPTPTCHLPAIGVWRVEGVCLYTSHFFSNPAKVAVAATAPTTEESGQTANGRRFLRVPNAPRGCRVAQSDGLVRLPILSADGHPKGARGHAPARSKQLPTVVSPQKILASVLRLFFTTGNLEL